MNQTHVNTNIWKSNTEQLWSGGKIIITEYEQKFEDNSNFWYKYVVKRSDGTIVEECKRVSIPLRLIVERIMYFQDIPEELATEMRECHQRYGKQKSWLAVGTNRGWSVS